jgi:hypothetical protein
MDLSDNVQLALVIGVVVVVALIVGRGLNVGFKNFFVSVDAKKERDEIEILNRVDARRGKIDEVTGTTDSAPADVSMLNDSKLDGMNIGPVTGKNVSGTKHRE